MNKQLGFTPAVFGFALGRAPSDTSVMIRHVRRQGALREIAEGWFDGAWIDPHEKKRMGGSVGACFGAGTPGNARLFRVVSRRYQMDPDVIGSLVEGIEKSKRISRAGFERGQWKGSLHPAHSSAWGSTLVTMRDRRP